MLISTIVVLDLGSRFTRLLTRRLRARGAYSVVLPASVGLDEVLAYSPAGVVLSGGPAREMPGSAPELPAGLLEAGVPLLGVAHGMELMFGQAAPLLPGAGGRADVQLVAGGGRLLAGAPGRFDAWFDGSPAGRAPTPGAARAGVEVTAQDGEGAAVALEDNGARLYGVAFHPELDGAAEAGDGGVAARAPGGRSVGDLVLENFLTVTGATLDWQPSNILQRLLADVEERVGDERVLLAISGGVDSSTLGVLLSRALGERLSAVFVDHGLLRHGEAEEVERALRGLGVDLTVVDARDRFLGALAGVEEPEQKRKIIGHEFVRLFEAEARRLSEQRGEMAFLAQGTLYPDVIESVQADGTVKVKSHHNVGGLPDEMGFELLEPFRYLFKDEVRSVARELGLPDALVGRHPFPGPGLAVRCLGEVTPERLEVLRAVDHVYVSTLREFGLYDRVWQALAVLTPLRSVGVRDGERTYGYLAALRAVNSVDGMTADWVRLPHDFLAEVSSRITTAVPQVNRVVYDISGKPPATIEWE